MVARSFATQTEFQRRTARCVEDTRSLLFASTRWARSSVERQVGMVMHTQLEPATSYRRIQECRAEQHICWCGKVGERFDDFEQRLQLLANSVDHHIAGARRERIMAATALKELRATLNDVQAPLGDVPGYDDDASDHSDLPARAESRAA